MVVVVWTLQTSCVFTLRPHMSDHRRHLLSNRSQNHLPAVWSPWPQSLLRDLDKSRRDMWGAGLTVGRGRSKKRAGISSSGDGWVVQLDMWRTWASFLSHTVQGHFLSIWNVNQSPWSQIHGTDGEISTWLLPSVGTWHHLILFDTHLTEISG